jgi:hypothetical protein
VVQISKDSVRFTGSKVPLMFYTPFGEAFIGLGLSVDCYSMTDIVWLRQTLSDPARLSVIIIKASGRLFPERTVHNLPRQKIRYVIEFQRFSRRSEISTKESRRDVLMDY